MTLEMLRGRRTPPCSIGDVRAAHRGLLEHGYNVTVFRSSDMREEDPGSSIRTDAASRAAISLALPYGSGVRRGRELPVAPACGRWRPFLAELARVARHAVIVDCPTVRSLNFISPLLFGMKKRWEGNTRRFTMFHESAVASAFRSGGFARGRRSPQFFFPMVLHRVLRAPRVSKAAEGICRVSGLTGFFGSPVILEFVRAGGGGR
jgi:hypothetical protein